MAVTTAPTQHAVLPAPRLSRRPALRRLIPALFVVANGIAFVLIRPDVNDLWAARARASAVHNGVGLTYWFSWFGGGTTPGNYSVLTPYACAVIGTELVGALSAVAIALLAMVLVRGTAHPVAAAWVAAIAAGTNLWSGRVPFLLGSAFAVGALIAVRHKKRTAAVLLTLVSILASPVSGAFVCLGLSGTFLTTRTRSYRPVIAWTVGAAVVALVGVAILFGAPGSEPYSTGLLAGLLLAHVLFWLARPPDFVRTTLGVSVIAAVVLWAVPNGLGSNFSRFVFFCLPAAVVATSALRTRLVALAVAPVLVMGGFGTAVDLLNAARPVSSPAYYRSLADRLDRMSDLRNYRVEVVNHGAHAGYDALLGHAMLARGWETQEDVALNASLNQPTLDAVTYKIWLDNNAVGYVALPASSVGGFPEYTLVQKQQVPYLHEIWSNVDWQLFRVTDPTPIVGRPGSVLAHDQKSMTIRVPCSCTIPVRLRWSKFLAASLQAPAPGGKTADTVPPVRAKIVNDGSGWTTLTTSEPGTYVLRGSLRGGLLG